MGLVEQPARGRLDRCREFFDRGDLRVAITALDVADLTLRDTAAVSDLFLRKAEALAGCPQILAEIAHGADRPA